MKTKNSLKAIALVAMLGLATAASVRAQEATPPQQEKPGSSGVLGKIFGQDPKTTTEDQKTGTPPPKKQATERLEPDDVNSLPSDVPE